MKTKFLLGVVLVCVAVNSARAQDAELVRREWTVEGIAREGLLHVPDAAKTTPSPVVFAFHGHGGTMRNAARQQHSHTVWPAAIVVYLQGLNTPGRLTDPEGKRPGWQANEGDQDDRDLKLFDAVLAWLKREYKVDERRIYSTGHSNGGGFTYLLWAARGDVLAAVAPSAAAAARQLRSLKPKPVLHVAGKNDELVKFEWQQATIEALRKLNGCEDAGMLFETDPVCVINVSKTGTHVVTLISDGTHAYNPDAPAVIVKFFKQHARP
jgi:polyhydroxybutyrate depolymerase